MLIGKVVHLSKSKVLTRRAATYAAPLGVGWTNVFSKPEFSAFAEVFRVHGTRFASTYGALHKGEFISNGVSHSFGSPDQVVWDSQALSGDKYSRWQHDLAFFFFAIPIISNDGERGIRTIAAMIQALERQLTSSPAEMRKFHWSPIAIASRILGLVTAMALAPAGTIDNSNDVEVIGAHIWRCTAVLNLSVERYLGYNHAATTEAGLAIGSLVQGKSEAASESFANLINTLEVCTLEDGLWAERTPTYHIHMLILAEAFKRVLTSGSPDYVRFDVLTRRMRRALDVLIHPDGEIAIFNDAAVADAPAPSLVGVEGDKSSGLDILPVGGYARLARSRTVVIMDAGAMGPDAVIGHGHADFLSIEVSIGDQRLIVDPGVASVGVGDDRNWTRSAATHNGPTLRGREPAEFFGAWRVGHRGTARFCDIAVDNAGTVSVDAECDGYERWDGVKVGRLVKVDKRGRVTIEDRWSGDGGEPVVSFLVPVDWSVNRVAQNELRLHHHSGEEVTLRSEGCLAIQIEESRYFREGPMWERSATRLTMVAVGRRLRTTIGHRADD